MALLTGTVRRPGGSIARDRSIQSRRPFCSTGSWGTASGPGDTLPETATAGVIARPGTVVPESPKIGGPGADAWAGS